MSKKSSILIKTYYLSLITLHGLLAPFLWVLSLIIPKLRKRVKQELFLNKKPLKDEAQVCFEVSSDGEYEQIAMLLTQMLENNKPVQLIIGSSSLYKKALTLNEKWEALDVRMVPLLSYFWVNLPWTSNLKKIVKSKHLVLCRYDFFPEIMLLGMDESRRFSLLSASLKSKSLKGLSYVFWHSIYGLFDHIVPASQAEQLQIKNLLFDAEFEHFDFRKLQILRRLIDGEQTLENWKGYRQFLTQLSNIDKANRVIIGSCWESELKILEEPNFIKSLKDRRNILVIAPHELDKQTIDKFLAIIRHYDSDLKTLVINEDPQNQVNLEDTTNNYEIMIIVKKGILVELYSLFGHAFVGGGYGRSIHSVLEPYLANCLVYCGPKVFRSTEYDLIYNESQDQISIIEEPRAFYDVFKTKKSPKAIQLNHLQDKITEEYNKQTQRLFQEE